MALRAQTSGHFKRSMTAHSTRILAIEVRRSRFGYALFEGPKRLLDWGASAVPRRLTNSAALVAARKRVAAVLRNCRPDTVILRRQRRMKSGKGPASGTMLRAIQHETADQLLAVQFLSRKAIPHAFRAWSAATKQEVAEVLARIFPELLVRLPTKRKAWQPEHQGMIIFDAVATGYAYLNKDDTLCSSAKES